MADRFIGREAELGLLNADYEQARGGQPRLVLIVGPAGIGKTALLRQHIERHRNEANILTAVADEDEAELAFGVLQQLIAPLAIPLAGHLTRVLTGAAATPEPLAVGMQLLAVLGDLEAEATVIVVIEDAQWSDRPSLTALTFALRRLRVDRVLGIVTLRSGAQASLPSGLLRLADTERGRWISVDGLSAAELPALSASAGVGELAPWMARRLWALTEGNPLYALTLLRELGADALRGTDPLPAPPSLSVLFLSRLARCSGRAVRLVRAAATLGQRSSLTVAARLAGLDEPHTAVGEASRAGLLRMDEEGSTITFAHPLVHAAVYGDLGPAERRALHARAAQLLDGEAALEHRVRASRPGDASLAEELRMRAGDDVRRGAWNAAARHLLAAARVEPDAAARADCLLRAAGLMLSAVDVAGMLALQEEIAALPPTPQRDYVFGHLAFLMGRVDEAEPLLMKALSGSDPEADPDVAAACAAWLAQCRIQASRGREAAELARTAIRLAPPGSPIGAFARGAELVGMGIAGEARPALTASAGKAGPPTSELDFVELTAVGILRLWSDDLADALRDLSAVEAFIATHGPIAPAFPALFYLADAELRAGAWDDALVHAQQHASLAADTDALYAAPYAESMLVSIHALRGEWSAADQHLAALADAPRTGDTAILAYASLAAARLAHARADSAAVLGAVAPLVAMGEMDGIREPGVVPWKDLYAEALLRLGRLDEAERVLHDLDRLAAERQLRSGVAAAALVRGSLGATRGAVREARAAFEVGLEQVTGLGMPFLQARLAVGYGAFLRRRGQRRAAIQRLEEAAELFRGLRAEPFLGRCERELQACGRTRASPGTAHLTLTPQELAVARLVARGLPNRAVAAELVISVKTVEYHLSNLFAKLGVTSRAQLAAQRAQVEDGSARPQD